MQETSATQTAAATAADLCQHFTLGEEAAQVLRPEHSPRQFLAGLVEKKLYPDAIQFIAHYLPKRQAVWWACHCARGTGGQPLPPPAAAALEVAERWVATPSEENRLAAHGAAEAADSGTAAGCAALAAFYSEGMPAPDPKSQAKAYFLTAKLVAGSVFLAAAKDPEKMAEWFGRFVDKGVEVINRTYA